MDVCLNPRLLEHNWTAGVRLKNGQYQTFWWTTWPSAHHTVAEVLWIASDLPRKSIHIPNKLP